MKEQIPVSLALDIAYAVLKARGTHHSPIGSAFPFFI
jgi:hypothetical protein